jgi:hypothetical protein
MQLTAGHKTHVQKVLYLKWTIWFHLYCYLLF